MELTEQKYLFSNPNARLLDIVFKFTKKKFNPLFFQQDFTDREFFEYFQKNHKPNPEKENILEHRAMRRFKELEKFLNITKFINGSGLYLDIGCNDCSITHCLGNILGFPLKNIYATDILQPKIKPDCTFMLSDGKTIPFTEKFQLITLFQSLHHMQHLDEMIKEIDRITEKNSYLIIREHNLGTEIIENNKLFMIEHAFYEIVYEGQTYDYFMDHHYAKYKSENEWDLLLSKIGFEKIKKYYIPKFNPTNYYYAIFIKK